MECSKKLHARIRGFTLVELLATLAVIVVMVGIGVPSFKNLVRDAHEQALVASYLHAFNTARYTAVATHRQVSICELDTKNRCSGHWGNRLAMFYDANRDGTANLPDDLIEQLELPATSDIKVSFRAFGRTRFVSLRANGHYRQNGTFRFCSPGNETGRAIVVNVAGRARTERISCV